MHTLWYVLLRERNLLATQKEETKRMGVPDSNQRVNGRKVYYVRLTSHPLINFFVDLVCLSYDRSENLWRALNKFSMNVV